MAEEYHSSSSRAPRTIQNLDNKIFKYDVVTSGSF